MRTLKFILEKEIRQVLRNRAILRIIFIAPIIQLILLPMAADFSVKNIYLAVVDYDHSPVSRQLVSKVTSSGHFSLVSYNSSYDKAYALVEKDKADLILEIPDGFASDLVMNNSAKVFMAINAIEGTKANLGGAYLSSILNNFSNEIDVQSVNAENHKPVPQINIASYNWYNPYLDFHLLFVPAILVTLMISVAAFQSTLNMLQEKEMGTIEQINVTPIKKYQFILGKLIPFWIMSMIIFTIGLLVQRFIYGITPVGSIALLYGSAAIYIFSLLGLGFLVATYTETQLQAMSLLFFVVMVFNMMSGIFTSIDSMPAWAYFLAHLFPVSHFVETMRMIVLKGSTFGDVKYHLLAIFLIGLVLNGWAVFNYKKTI